MFFSHLGQCKYLGMGLNDFTIITPGAFDGLHKIQVMHLGDGKLTELNSGMFEGAESVQDLWLDNNDIATIDEDTFINLKNLTRLHLYINNLMILPQQIFNGPLELLIDNNPLICDAALCWLKQEELNRNVIFTRDFVKPRCANGVNWDTWVCTVPSKSIAIS